MQPVTLRAAALAVALTLPPAAALAAGSSAQTRVVNDCGRAHLKPARIVIACGDGTEVLTKLHWSSWKRATATGTGVDNVVSCNPDCAAGKRTAYPVAVTLSRPQTCPGRRYTTFTRAVLKFGPTHPRKSRTETDTFPCHS